MCGWSSGACGHLASQALGWDIRPKVSRTTPTRVLVLLLTVHRLPARSLVHLQRALAKEERFYSPTFNSSLCSCRPNQYPLPGPGQPSSRLWLLKAFS